MTHLETAKYNSIGNGYKAITKYLAELYSIEEFGTLNTNFMVAYKELNTLVDKQIRASQKIKNNATKAKTELVETILKYAVKAKVIAINIDNYQLYNALNIDSNHFTSCSKMECMHRAIEVRNVLKYNMSKLPNINNEVITEIDNILEKYDGIVDGVNKKQSTSIIKPKHELNELLDRCSFFYNQICDLAESCFSKSRAAMISELVQAKIVANRSGNETTLSFKILDKVTETPIIDAIIIDDNTGKIFKTAQTGIIEIPSPRAGTFQFKIVDTTVRDNQVFLAVVKQGRVNDFTIKL